MFARQRPLAAKPVRFPRGFAPPPTVDRQGYLAHKNRNGFRFLHIIEAGDGRYLLLAAGSELLLPPLEDKVSERVQNLRHLIQGFGLRVSGSGFGS